MPDGHFHIFIFSENKFYAFFNGENHSQIRGLVAELHVCEYGGTIFGFFFFFFGCFVGKLALNVEDFYIKNNRVGLKMFLAMKHGKVGYIHIAD